MNHEQAVALLKSALLSVAPAKAAEIDSAGLDTKIRDLGVDSVAAMEMVGFIEEKLEVTFPDEDLAQLSRFSDIVDLITSNAR